MIVGCIQNGKKTPNWRQRMNDDKQIPTSQPSRQNKSKPFTRAEDPNLKKRFRNQGKSRYAQKKNRNTKPVTQRPAGPVNNYTSVCCKVLATKPRCGQKETALSPDTKKAVEVSKGLGKWSCSGCHKPCKVTVSKHKEEEEAVPTNTERSLV